MEHPTSEKKATALIRLCENCENARICRFWKVDNFPNKVAETGGDSSS